MVLMILTRSARLRSAAFLLAAAVIPSGPGYAQEEGPDAPESMQPGFSSLNVAQPRGTRELQNALQRLSLNPADIDALIDGGNAALLLGDPQAAIGFFARADEMSPGNGRVKAGLGSGLLLNENPYEALRLFAEALKLGVPETVFAADRGLAYDLVGNFDAAQGDYELALRRGSDDETIRRYALSLAIAGDRVAAEAQLDPLLRKRDAAAWRTRAFVLAVTGDPQGAVAIADATMPKRMAASIEPFFRFMGKLTPAQQAAAAHFGNFPQSAAVGKDDPRNRQYASAGTPRPRTGRADSGLIPVGEPLGPSADSKGRKTARADKSQRRRPGKLSRKEQAQIAAAQAEAAARPVPVQVQTAGPVPPADLLVPGRGVARAMVQAIPPAPAPGPAPVRTASSSATVQPLPSESGTSRRTGRMAASQTRQDPPASVTATATGAATSTGIGTAMAQSPQASPPAVMNAVKESVRQPRTAIASAAPVSSPPPPPPVAAPSRSVQVAGLDDQVRPGFSSLSVNSAPAALPPVATPPVLSQPQPQITTPPTVASTTQQSAAATIPAGTDAGALARSTAFDLARMGPPAPVTLSAGSPSMAATTSVSPAPAKVQALPPAAAPARISLAAIIADIKVPPQELAPDEDAVDVTRIKPSPPKAAPPKPEVKTPEVKKVAAKPAPPKHPKRYWVQIAGGANRADLAKEWKRLSGNTPAAFKGKQGWWTPLNATNRLLAGPFGSEKEAQGFVNTLSKEKLSAFAFTSSEGQEVTKLGG